MGKGFLLVITTIYPVSQADHESQIPWNSLMKYICIYIYNWAVLSDEQMSNGYPFSLPNDEQTSNKVGVEHQPDNHIISYNMCVNLY